MKRVHNLMRQAVAGEVFPGGVLLVSRGNTIRFFKTYGVASLRTRTPVTRDTVFDLASLTKPLATTPAVMTLIASGRLDLADRLGDILPPFHGSGKSGITVRQLLAHRSGLPAYRPYFIPLSNLEPRRRQPVLREFLLREPLIGRPGEKRLYSDVGFMVLQWVVESITGQSLDGFVKRTVYDPMGAQGLFFPGFGRKTTLPFAATERCGLRRRIIQGEVHDENAYVLGGAAGHAGLFGTAGAVRRFLVDLTNLYKGRTKAAGSLRRETAARFFNGGGGEGPLGFDAPSPTGSGAGRFFGPRSIGHLGFTGTSFWVDLDRDAMVILLTNRVHPSRKNLKIKAFRPLVHDEIMKTLAEGS